MGDAEIIVFIRGKRNRAVFSAYVIGSPRLGPEFGPNERLKDSIWSIGVLYTPLKTKALRVSIVGVNGRVVGST